MANEDWIIQLKWQAQGNYDAAALMMRVYGGSDPNVAMYAALITRHAEGTDKLREQLEEQNRSSEDKEK